MSDISALSADPTAPAVLTAQSLEISVGTRRLVDDLSLSFNPGEFVAILGRNGSGKTLTLHTLAGLRAVQADAGSPSAVLLDGAALSQWNRRALARCLGVLLQDLEAGFPTTVLQAVLIGRHPHLHLLEWEKARDVEIAQAALQRMGLGEFAARRTDTLSGGEQRRVAIATLLAQQPQVFLLDEPTNHLDPHHQLAVLSLFRELADAGHTVVATLHDPTLAARFADRALLLHGDGRWRTGNALDVLTGEALTELYLTPITAVDIAGRRVFTNG